MTFVEEKASNPSSPASLRWLAIGQSGDPDALIAGREAAERAMAGQTTSAKLLTVYCWHGYDFDALLGAIAGVVGDVPIIGCSTAGEIANGHAGTGGVVITALGGEGFQIETGFALDASKSPREAATGAAQCMNRLQESDYSALLILAAGLGGDQEEMVKGAYAVTGAAVPLVGGISGDDLRMQETFQFCGRQVMTDAVVCAAIGSDSPVSIGVGHGWARVGAPMTVTRAEGTRVYELNDMPALDAYFDQLNAPDNVRNDPQEFAGYAIVHPLGVSRRTGDEVRFIAEANYEDRSIGCIAIVPEGGLAYIMEGNTESVLTSAGGAADEAIKGLNGHAPIGAMVFDCIARRGVIGDEGIVTEARNINEALNAPTAGFYTYGEIARTSGMHGFHNQTVVVFAFS